MSDLDEQEADTRDNCDAFAILDDLPVRAMDECEVCGAHECRHFCGFCKVMRNCLCDDEALAESLAFRDSLFRGPRGGRSRR